MKTINAIIFNTGVYILTDIVNFINSHDGIKVHRIEILYLNNCYDTFLDDIYKLGPIPEYDINLKKTFVKKANYPQIAFLLSINFSTLNEKYSYRKKKKIYVESETLKKEVRDKFKDYVDGYFHDILYHSSDCDEEQAYLNQVINYYKCAYGYDEIINIENNESKVKKIECKFKKTPY